MCADTHARRALSLQELDLQNNDIKDGGVIVLAHAYGSGGMPMCDTINLAKNPASSDTKKYITERRTPGVGEAEKFSSSEKFMMFSGSSYVGKR